MARVEEKQVEFAGTMLPVQAISIIVGVPWSASSTLFMSPKPTAMAISAVTAEANRTNHSPPARVNSW